MIGGSIACLGSTGPSFVYIEQGASHLVSAAIAAARMGNSTLQVEEESLAIGVRAALRRLSANEGWTHGVVAVSRDEAPVERQSGRASLARVMLARSAGVGPGSLTFVASQDANDELRQQLFALTQVLTEEFPRASVRIRFVPSEDTARRARSSRRGSAVTARRHSAPHLLVEGSVPPCDSRVNE